MNTHTYREWEHVYGLIINVVDVVVLMCLNINFYDVWNTTYTHNYWLFPRQIFVFFCPSDDDDDYLTNFVFVDDHWPSTMFIFSDPNIKISFEIVVEAGNFFFFIMKLIVKNHWIKNDWIETETKKQ